MDTLPKLSLSEHLGELRQCLINSCIGVGITFTICYAFAKDIGRWFLNPLFEVLPQGTTLVFTSYQEAFFFI